MDNCIVVGVDGSDTGRRALQWALSEAGYRDVTVRAVTSWAFEQYLLPDVSSPAAARKRAEHVLDQDIAAATHGMPSPPAIDRIVVEGGAARSLLEASADAVLLVVGSHGHRQLFDVLLGSVSAHCVRHARCPVVVVPSPRKPPRHSDAVISAAAPMY